MPLTPAVPITCPACPRRRRRPRPHASPSPPRPRRPSGRRPRGRPRPTLAHRLRELRHQAEREVTPLSLPQLPARHARPEPPPSRDRHPLLHVLDHLLGRRPPRRPPAAPPASGPCSRSCRSPRRRPGARPTGSTAAASASPRPHRARRPAPTPRSSATTPPPRLPTCHSRLRNRFRSSPKTSEHPVFVGHNGDPSRSQRVRKRLAEPETAGSTCTSRPDPPTLSRPALARLARWFLPRGTLPRPQATRCSGLPRRASPYVRAPRLVSHQPSVSAAAGLRPATRAAHNLSNRRVNHHERRHAARRPHHRHSAQPRRLDPDDPLRPEGNRSKATGPR